MLTTGLIFLALSIIWFFFSSYMSNYYEKEMDKNAQIAAIQYENGYYIEAQKYDLIVNKNKIELMVWSVGVVLTFIPLLISLLMVLLSIIEIIFF